MHSTGLGAIFMVQAWIIFAIVSIIADTFAALLQPNARNPWLLGWIQSGILIGIGVYLALGGK